MAEVQLVRVVGAGAMSEVREVLVGGALVVCKVR